MEVTGPSNLWKGFDAAALPLNLSELSAKTENGVTVRELYFDGFATIDGRVRAFIGIHEVPDPKGVILYLSDIVGDPNDGTIKSFIDMGYTVAALDYLGKSDKFMRYTLYPRSLSACNCRNAKSFDTAEDTQNSRWYVWMCLARKATLLLKTRYPDMPLFALGKGIGGSTVYKISAFNDGISASATLLNIIPSINGVGNPLIMYRASLDNAAYAPLTNVPLFMSVASNDEDGSLDAMSSLASKTSSLKGFRIVERAFAGGVCAVYPQIDRFFASAGEQFFNSPKIKPINSENNLYFEIDANNDADRNRRVELYASFCIENPTLRSWMNLELVGLGGKEFLARSQVYDNTKPVYAFVNITDDAGNTVSSELISIIPKTLGIPSQPTVKRHLIYDGSMGKDVWTSPKGGTVEIKSGLFGIDGVYSDTHSIATFKPGDSIYRADEGMLLQIMISGKTQKITISVYDGNDEYVSSVDIPNYDKWYKFTLSQSDFKSVGGQLSSWTKVNMIKFTSTDDFIIGSILWV